MSIQQLYLVCKFEGSEHATWNLLPSYLRRDQYLDQRCMSGGKGESRTGSYNPLTTKNLNIVRKITPSDFKGQNLEVLYLNNVLLCDLLQI